MEGVLKMRLQLNDHPKAPQPASARLNLLLTALQQHTFILFTSIHHSGFFVAVLTSSSPAVEAHIPTKEPFLTCRLQAGNSHLRLTTFTILASL